MHKFTTIITIIMAAAGCAKGGTVTRYDGDTGGSGTAAVADGYLVWLEDGGNVVIPDGPPSHTWAIHDRAGNLIGVADGSTVEGAFLAWCELAGYDLETACRRAGIARCSPNDLRRSSSRAPPCANSVGDLCAT